MSSSLSDIPSRGRCIQATDYTPQCQCEWFAEPTSPLLNQFSCAACGHGTHSHVDYVSTTVCHNVATNCAAYVQKTPLTQRCTCSVHLADHRPILNLHRLQDPFYVLDLLATSIKMQSDGPHLGVPYIPSILASGTLAPLDDATNITSSQTRMPSPSTSQSMSVTQTTQSSDHHEFIFTTGLSQFIHRARTHPHTDLLLIIECGIPYDLFTFRFT
ncbi:hypothetical protein ARMSODRAFT_997990 [Armillaria solidipes]|uniref:Uncharacterized protein n=1 Tax=Armillaria solidipes TaxID=1076256 RepID=A0A2H3CGX8_9AGAR|nr:hypothetical protein ARMSODRAFT_997990 [Armillaria solidipes]